MSFSVRDPFFGDVPASVHLPQTPLTGVLAQVRFPEILSISKRDFVAAFQEAIRKAYPNHQREDGIQLVIGPDGPQPQNVVTWRFLDAKRQWRITLTPSFISLETRSYTSRDDFTARVLYLVAALQKTIDPGYLTRVGVRYIDRISGDHLSHLDRYVRPEVIGIYQRDLRNKIDSTISELHAATNCGKLSARCGIMPPNQSHEMDLMPPISELSWFLDIDTYQEFNEPIALNADDVAKRTMDLATRSHGFFRWATNDELLRSYGGEL